MRWVGGKNLLLLAALQVTTSGLPFFPPANYALAAPNASQIEQVLKEAKLIPDGAAVRVAVADKEARIITFIQSPKGDVDRDCKIDSVMMARSILNKFSDLSSTVVDFYSVPAERTYREVVVTRPELVAFGTGVVESEELLSGIRLEKRVDQRIAAEDQKKRQEQSEKLEKSRTTARETIEKAKSSGEHPESRWVTYQAAGLSFSYPGAWTISRESDGETLVKFASPATTYYDASLELKLYRNPRRLPVAEEAEQHAAGHHRFFQYQQTQPMQVMKFGVGNSFTGVAESFAYMNSGAPCYERHVYFGWPGYVYKMRMSCRRDDYTHVSSIFDHVLSTLRLQQAPTSR